MKVPFSVLASILILGAAVPAVASAAAPWKVPSVNPCQSPEAPRLLCPDLRIGTPSEMYVSEYEGKTVLHATSDVQSRGRGPIEVRGQRDGPRSMKVTQRIYKVGGGHITVRTDASR